MASARRILVVEDQFLIAMELQAILQSAGYVVLGPAPSVSVALDLIHRERPDAAVLDVNVAGERVTPVAEVLRALSIPFLLASGYDAKDLSGDRVLHEAVNVGKPLVSKRLLAELAGLFV